MPSEPPSRSLVVIGGGEERPGAILGEFVRLAGGDRARVVVVSAASDEPGPLEDEYRRAFRALGVPSVDVVRHAHGGDPVRALHACTGVFFTGGTQRLLVDRLAGTPALEVIRERWCEGLVVAGTSAGASAMSAVMIESGEAETDPYPGAVRLGRGFGFLPGVVIDQHFAERGRIGRLLAALAERPGDLALGIAENTAAVVRGAAFRVAGRGAVTVLDAHAATRRDPGSGHPFALCGVTLHVLPEGYGFDLSGRSPLPPLGRGGD